MHGAVVQLALGVAAAANAEGSLATLLEALEREPALSAAMASLTAGRAFAVVG
jgi:hypothetical protein